MSAPPAFLQRPGRINSDPTGVHAATLAHFTAGATWKIAQLHDRTRDLLIWVTRGQGRVVLNGVRRGIGTHNALFVPAGTLLALDLGAQGLAQVVESAAGVTARMPRGPLHLRIREGLAQAELTGHIDAMQREISQDRPLIQDALQGYMRLIAVWLRRQERAGTVDAPRDTATHRLAARFARQVVRDFRTDRTMADYADSLDVTPTHLSRVCRAACGKTAADMLTERRLYEARLLLAHPQPPIRDVAASLGFHSPAYFTRFIQSHTGQTPSGLRRSALGG